MTFRRTGIPEEGELQRGRNMRKDTTDLMNVVAGLIVSAALIIYGTMMLFDRRYFEAMTMFGLSFIVSKVVVIAQKVRG